MFAQSLFADRSTASGHPAIGLPLASSADQLAMSEHEHFLLLWNVAFFDWDLSMLKVCALSDMRVDRRRRSLRSGDPCWHSFD